MSVLAEILLWLLFYPVMWLLTSPWILIASFFGNGTYWKNVREKYQAVTDWCHGVVEALL